MQHRSPLAVGNPTPPEPVSLVNAFADTVLLPSSERPRAHARAVDSRHVVGMVSTFGAAPVEQGGAAREQHLVPLRFTGTGTGYFGVCALNLLLIVLTVGLYTPWARARRLRYLYQHTQLEGHGFDFVGAPHKMLLGLAIAVALAGFLGVAFYFSPVTGFVALLITSGLWPVLHHSALRFRMSNTRWRGQNLRYEGRSGDAYLLWLTLLLPALVLAGAHLGVPPGQPLPDWFLVTAGLVGAATLAIAPWALWQWQRLRRHHLGYGNLRLELRGTADGFYGIALAALGMALALAVPLLAGAWALAAAGNWPHDLWAQLPSWASPLVAAVLGWLLLKALPLPYATSRMQTLLWACTGNAQVRFKCELRCRDLVALNLKNSLLLLLTAGLYAPYARVAQWRLRLQSISLISRTQLDELVLQSRSHPNHRLVSSLFSMDVGW
jgi:uncharacterized membrane protein YjgN (DUF898 family)